MLNAEQINDFVKGYAEGMLWANLAYNTETGFPESDNLGEVAFWELSDETRKAIREDAKQWLAIPEVSALLLVAIEIGSYNLYSAGIDFSLSRNGHGAGFWDRDLYAEDCGERLHEHASSEGSAYVSVETEDRPETWLYVFG